MRAGPKGIDGRFAPALSLMLSPLMSSRKGHGAVRTEDQIYHRDRARQCRAMAVRAADPEVRRRHEELAELHARQAGPEFVELRPEPAV